MTTVKKPMSFNDFCYKILDGMYEPRLPYENQCTGYKLLRKMVMDDITPATKEEYDRWKNNPTMEELLSTPDLKYLTFLHELTRPIIREHWNKIKQLNID
jgi:hypothetical protein